MISFPVSIPPEFDLEQYVDYDKQYEKTAYLDFIISIEWAVYANEASCLTLWLNLLYSLSQFIK